MNTDNPYQAPTHVPTNKPENSEFIIKVAKAQRQVNIGVLSYLCLILLNVGTGAVAINPELRQALIGFLALIVVVYCVVAVFQLAAALRGNIAALFYALGMFVPCLGLILLIILSQEATAILKRKGIRVGLLGANPADLN